LCFQIVLQEQTMVQATLRWISSALGSVLEWLTPLAFTGLWVLAALVVASLVLYALDRDGFKRARDWLLTRASRIWVWLPVALVFAVSVFATNVAREGVLERFRVQRDAKFSTLEDPAGGQTIQYSPNVSFEREVSYSRSVTIPGFLGQKLSTLEAAQLIAPYLVDPASENIKKLADSFKRSGKDLVFTREATVRQNDPVALELADVIVDFSFGDTGAGRSYYSALFTGKYKFKNPNPEPAMLRFSFPLPEQSGTLSDFEFKFADEVVPQPDLSSGYSVEREVAANAEVEVSVKYKNQGAGTWTYDFGKRREPIKNFKLTINTPRAVKFLRGSLHPNERGLSSLTWNLKNVITSQGVVLSFPERSLRETLTKVFSFAPLALLLASVWTFAWAWRRNLKLEPVQVALVVLAFTVGIGAMAVLLGYVTPSVASWFGELLALGLSSLVLGRRFLLPLAGSALAPLAFLSVGNAGLLLGILAVIVILSILPANTFDRFRRLHLES
jgi:hypothetical protein